MDIVEKRFMTIKELGEYLTLSRWTIYNLVSQRKIPFIPISRKALRFDREQIDQWLEKRSVKTVKDFIKSV